MASNHPPIDSARQARTSYLLLAGLFVVLTVISMGWDLLSTPAQVKNLASSIGRSFFKEMVVTRQWNALHGGVYVPVTEDIRPNTYLKDPLRDVVTTEGLMLTKINPAYMTRLIAEFLATQDGVQLHITSLNPINPGNVADEWESQALALFEAGTIETASVEWIGDVRFSRFMAPLLVDESCLPCHADQGYVIGDIRGGISISLPWEPFSSIVTANQNRVILLHLVLALAGVSIILLLSKRVVAGINALQSARDYIASLEGILPVCMHCRKVRQKDGDPADPASWIALETFVKKSIDTDVSHGICPDCLKEHYSET